MTPMGDVSPEFQIISKGISLGSGIFLEGSVAFK